MYYIPLQGRESRKMVLTVPSRGTKFSIAFKQDSRTVFETPVQFFRCHPVYLFVLSVLVILFPTLPFS